MTIPLNDILTEIEMERILFNEIIGFENDRYTYGVEIRWMKVKGIL